MYLVTNLIVLIVAIAGGVIAENFAITGLFGISPYVASFGGQPQVWLCRFLEPLVSLSILTVWLWRNGEDWRSLGLRRPSDWWRLLFQISLATLGLVAVIALFMFALVYPWHLRISAPPDIRDTRTLAAALFFTLFGTGLNQELQFRGFLQNRLVTVFGGGVSAWHWSIVVTGIVFGLFHIALGPANAVIAGLTGVFLGEVYLWTNKNLWVVVAAHSIGNAIALMYSYWQA